MANMLLEKLGVLLNYHANLIDGAETEVQQLKEVLGLLQTFIQAAQKKVQKQELDLGMKRKQKLKQGQELERQMKEVIYDAEDTIDAYLSTQAPTPTTNIMNIHRRRSQKSSIVVVSLAEELNSLTETKLKPMLDMVFENMPWMPLKPQLNTSSKVPFKKDIVVGFDRARHDLISLLLEETNELDVISIVGSAGQGKTTLASLVFRDTTIQHTFLTRIWVCVSGNFSLKATLLEILKHFNLYSNNDNDLAKLVCFCLEQRKFLLVLDDVWTVEAWKAIQQALPKTNSKGKVLITTRFEDVAVQARIPHNLNPLCMEDNWELFQYAVFGKLNKCPHELEGIGMRICKKCRGHPFAAVVIGGILANLFSTNSEISAIEKAWTKVANYLYWDKELREGSNVAELSYNNLPHELRDCFLYLGVFPEDYEICARTLIRLWIAEGFVQCKDGQCPEETAEDILKDLICRNLVMVEKINQMGKVKSCRIHDEIRDFCIFKAGNRGQLFKEIKMSEEGVFDPPISEIPKHRRLCIHSNFNEFLSQKQLNGPRVRSFLSFCKDSTTQLNAKYTSTIPDAFNLLRVLDSKSFKFNHFTLRFTKLIHLRYLTLSCDDLTNLPNSISELWNLQTLVVETEVETLEIRANIWKMIQLRHLKTTAIILLVNKGEADQACVNLQTLTKLSPECCTNEVFNKAPNLKKLGIRGNLATLFDGKHSLDVLHCLENLKMVHALPFSSTSVNQLRELQLSSFFPPWLKQLTLSGTRLSWSQISTLQRIVSLRVLKLKNNAFNGNTWKAEGGGFCSLQFLIIEDLDFVFWKTSPEDFPVLTCLVIKKCENLSEIPMDLAKSLRKLNLDYVGKSVIEIAKKIMRESEIILGHGFELEIGPRVGL